MSSQEWAPYHYIKAGQIQGKAVEAVDCVLSKMKQDYQIIMLPWMRAQMNTKSGIFDAFFSASDSDKRDKFAVHSNVFS